MKKIVSLLLVAALAGSAVAAQPKNTPAKKTKATFIVVEDETYAAGKEDAGLTAGLAQFLNVTP